MWVLNPTLGYKWNFYRVGIFNHIDCICWIGGLHNEEGFDIRYCNLSLFKTSLIHKML